MFENVKAKIFIANLVPIIIKNEKTGEARTLTKITYLVKAPSTENFKGSAIMEAYSNEKAFTLLERFLDNTVMAEIEQRPDVRGSKFYILAVNDVRLK